jgi:hypothetical protein
MEYEYLKAELTKVLWGAFLATTQGDSDMTSLFVAYTVEECFFGTPGEC